jgi:hypothetical protein
MNFAEGAARFADGPPAEIEEDDSTEEITVTCRWETVHTITVPKGWRPTAYLKDFPPGTLNEINSGAAELVDWS